MRHRPLISITLALGSALLLAGVAAAATALPPKKAATTKVAPKPAPPTPATQRQQAKNAAKGLALATETVEAISAAQLDVAARVLTGQADCEFNQRIDVAPLDGRPGYFTVSHMGRHYRMLPRETSTGAVRLEDPANGIVWLQIPAKSMLMNARRGQRMVDSCMHAEQRAATSAVAAAAGAQGIGIVAAPAAAAAPTADTATAAATVAPAAVPVVASDPPTPAVVVAPPAALAPPAGAGTGAPGG